MATAKLFVQLLLIGLIQSIDAECLINDTVCTFYFDIEHMLTMMHKTGLVYPHNGNLYLYNVTDPGNADTISPDEVIVGDGWEDPRLVSVVNGQLPGPDIIVYEHQTVIVHVKNKLSSTTAAIHWHGLNQWMTPGMDGVPWVTQCPIQPGQTFRYEFKANPRGTFWWHSHSGIERTMGTFGAFIIKSRNETGEHAEEYIMQINDWNHDWTSDTAYAKLEYGIYDGRVKWQGVKSLDNSSLTPFKIQSGLINGRGRYYYPNTNDSTMAPLTVYNVTEGNKYRFRVIGTGLSYPFRVSIDSHVLTIIASDGYDLEPITAESFIINPGERFDFEITANQSTGNYWVRAITLETMYHKAEAILRYEGAPMEEPTTSRKTCIANDQCLVINCPFTYYPVNHTICRTFDALKALSTGDRAPPYHSDRFKEYFLNFGFPPSINGRTFDQPTVNPLWQPNGGFVPCEAPACGDDKHCTCTHALSIGNNDTVQMIFTNVGHGKGVSHPIHMHGHSFYVIKMGYGQYDPVTAAIGNDTADINCRGNSSLNFCNNATWTNQTWLDGHVPNVELDRPPRKDTIIVPTGGYVVIRIRADNPGLWNFHCHIDFHNLGGMRMILNESFSEIPPKPDGFPECHSYPPDPSISCQTIQQ